MNLKKLVSGNMITWAGTGLHPKARSLRFLLSIQVTPVKSFLVSKVSIGEHRP